MITVDYFGRTGNNLFQYCVARLVAMTNGCSLGTRWNDNAFIEAIEPLDRPEKVKDKIEIGDLPNIYAECLKNRYYDINLHGYYQNAEFYNRFRNRIKEFFRLTPVVKNTEDIVIHLRLTDYWWRPNSCVISPMWYLAILKKQKFRKLYIVVEPHITNKKYLSYFSQFRNEVVSGTPKSDFEFLRSFDRIVCSNSTFAWWAAFLSDASKIWIFKRWMGLHRKDCLRLANVDWATVVDGEFIRNKHYEVMDWTDYWKKPEESYV